MPEVAVTAAAGSFNWRRRRQRVKIDHVRALTVLRFHAVNREQQGKPIIDLPVGGQAAVEYQLLANLSLGIRDHQRMSDTIAASKSTAERYGKIIAQREISVYVSCHPAA